MNVSTSSDYRLLQVILGHNGVYEVYGHVDTQELVCNCPGFRFRKTCKHTQFVASRLSANGVYELEVVMPADVTDEQVATMASQDPKAFRDWVLRCSRIEVL